MILMNFAFSDRGNEGLLELRRVKSISTPHKAASRGAGREQLTVWIRGAVVQGVEEGGVFPPSRGTRKGEDNREQYDEINEDKLFYYINEYNCYMESARRGSQGCRWCNACR